MLVEDTAWLGCPGLKERVEPLELAAEAHQLSSVDILDQYCCSGLKMAWLFRW